MSAKRNDQLPTTLVPATPTGHSADRPLFSAGHRLPGKPSLMTRETVDRFMTAVRGGNSYADAARYAGLKPDTVEKWMRRGRGMLRDAPATPEYVNFVRLAEENKATARVYVVGNLVARSRVDTRAAELWLRVHGGDEWRDDDAPGPGAPPAEHGDTYIDARQQQVIVIPAEQVPAAVHRLLAARRESMPVDPIPPAEDKTPDGPSRARHAGLREDG